MLLGDRRNVVDRQVEQQYIAIGTEAHVVDRLRIDADPQSSSRVSKVRQKCFSVAIRVSIVRTGVIDFSGVFESRGPSTALEVQAIRPSANIFRQG